MPLHQKIKLTFVKKFGIEGSKNCTLYFLEVSYHKGIIYIKSTILQLLLKSPTLKTSKKKILILNCVCKP